jgi:hypothetical protein
VIEDISNVLAWALCGGILLTVVLIWVYVYVRIAWYSIKRRRAKE